MTDFLKFEGGRKMHFEAHALLEVDLSVIHKQAKSANLNTALTMDFTLMLHEAADF